MYERKYRFDVVDSKTGAVIDTGDDEKLLRQKAVRLSIEATNGARTDLVVVRAVPVEIRKVATA